MFQSKSETPILDALEKNNLPIGELHKLILLHGDILEWGVSYYMINKLRSNEFHSKVKTPAEGLTEGAACLIDFMRDLDKEVDIKKKLNEK